MKRPQPVDERSVSRTLVGSLVGALVLACLALPASAYADESDEGRRYNGSFLAAGLFGGAHFPEAGRPSDVGWAGGAYARISSVMQVMDGQLEYHASGGTFEANGAPVRYMRHSLSSSLNLHPFFLRLLNNNWLWAALTSFYVQFGGSVEFALLDTEPDPEAAFSLHIGAGIDVPITQPESSGAFWIGVNWRWKFVYDEWEVRGAELDPDAHLLFLVVSYRYNNLSFARIERPPELKYR